jgi:dihydroorotase
VKIWEARIIDPVNGTDTIRDLMIPGVSVEIDARGLIACPGLIDLHTHLRARPDDSETNATGASAALRACFATVCCMPHTEPAIDSVVLMAVVQRTEQAATRVLPIAAVTRGLRMDLC